MDIRKALRKPANLSLVLIYAISFAALCLRAPVVQQPVQLTSDDVETQPNPSQDPYTAIAKPIDPKQLQSVNQRAPLWALSSQLSLNVPIFAAEQAELIGAVLIVALAYRFRARLLAWGAATWVFIASRRRGTCIWLGFAIVLALTTFPPWVQVNTYGGKYPTQHVKLWHARIDRPPIETTRWQSSEVDYDRMLTEIGVGECFVLSLYLTWARSKRLASR